MLYKGFSNAILVIDESLVARKTICRNLEYYKYKALEAVDGMEALKLFREKQSDIGLVIIDPKMAKYSADDVLSQLRELDSAVRVIAITENTDGLDQKIYRDVVRKPVRTDRLLAVVKKGLED